MNLIKINNIEIPNPQDINLSYQTIEKVQQSEAGTDLVTLIRTNKRTLTFTARCDSIMFYNYLCPAGDKYVGRGIQQVQFPDDEMTHWARVRIKSAKMIHNSEDLSAYGNVGWYIVRGLWEVGIEIIEI